MQWSETLPTEPGWYFWKPSEATRIVFRRQLVAGVYQLELCGFDGEERLHLALPKNPNRYPAEWMAGSWAGPIPEPTE